MDTVGDIDLAGDLENVLFPSSSFPILPAVELSLSLPSASPVSSRSLLSRRFVVFGSLLLFSSLGGDLVYLTPSTFLLLGPSHDSGSSEDPLQWLITWPWNFTPSANPRIRLSKMAVTTATANKPLSLFSILEKNVFCYWSSDDNWTYLTAVMLCYCPTGYLLQTHIVLHNKGPRMLESGHELTRFTRNATLKRHTLSGWRKDRRARQVNRRKMFFYFIGPSHRLPLQLYFC